MNKVDEINKDKLKKMLFEFFSQTKGEAREAQKRIDDRIAELQGKGMRLTDAMDAARVELTDDFKALYGNGHLEKVLSEHPVNREG